MEPHTNEQTYALAEACLNLAEMPPEILGMIFDQVSLFPSPYKGMLAIARTCRTLAAHVLPRLYSRDVADSLKLPRKLDMPIALQWACWFGVLGAARASIEALTMAGVDVAAKISHPFNNDNLYSLRYRMSRRRGLSGPAYGYLHWRNNSSLLHLACIRGNTAVAKLLMEKGVHPDMPDGAKLPALAYALNADVARLLIEHGANVNVTHDGDETALCHLISLGPMETRDWGTEFNVPQGNGALQAWHTTQDVVGAIKYLIQEAGADIFADKIRTVSPLQQAVLTRYLEVVKLLLDAGASPNPIDTRTGEKRLLLADALEPGYNKKVVELILSAGAEADFGEAAFGGESHSLPIMNLTLRGSNPLYAKEEVQVAHLVCGRMKNINVEINGHAPLWNYVRKGRQDIGQVMIEHGADPEKANVEVRDTVLSLVARD
ncbi:hypothetical protein NM208_g13990 [Fusarium decemcellulare]|uniref:Uncharacterized protein n=1 Tax=Fusarium decemcellulare TaxID=57161 RepID=A0ACC1RKB3_9HYPO|nr:hypothetical protein NM208_g13990 [Fusarium decemcellulare]